MCRTPRHPYCGRNTFLETSLACKYLQNAVKVNIPDIAKVGFVNNNSKEICFKLRAIRKEGELLVLRSHEFWTRANKLIMASCNIPQQV